ncbi:cupredoxin domain-containing protein [Candidatus Uhrbacteria bacterium]|nr:cupredoxin domain-containing protein [Candidatus Uhrbacteria bacterium]
MNYFFTIAISVIGGMLFGISPVDAAPVLSGRILLDVEQNGEAWYVQPTTNERVFLGRPADAFRVMRELGLGIRTQELAGIPPALLPVSGPDSDGDGLADSFEEALGTDPQRPDTDGDGYGDKEEIQQNYSPTGPSRFQTNQRLLNRMQGRILLQVETAGQAWYVYPIDGKRYYLGRPEDAFRIMRELSLGITHANLLLIPERGSARDAQPVSLSKTKEKPTLVDMSAKEFSLTPYSTKIDADKPLRMIFKNNGAAPHNLTVKELGIGTPTIAPGESAILEFDSLEPGIYTLNCSVSGHRERGMEAFLRAL